MEDIADNPKLDPYSTAKWGQFVQSLPVEEYKMYTVRRNEYYKNSINFLKDQPETLQHLESTSVTLQNSLHAYNSYEAKDKGILKEFHDLFEELEKAKKEVKNIETKIDRAGFNDFSH